MRVGFGVRKYVEVRNNGAVRITVIWRCHDIGRHGMTAPSGWEGRGRGIYNI